MSVRWLHRELGIVLQCDGCEQQQQTANIKASANRMLAAKSGWGRGLRAKRSVTALPNRRKDYCPTCMIAERAAAEEAQTKRNERLAKRDASRLKKVA